MTGIGPGGLRRKEPNTFPRGNQAAAVAIGEWLQHNGIDNSEYCRTCADAQGQCQYCRRRESRTFAQHSHGMADVLDEYVQARRSPHLAHLLLQNPRTEPIASTAHKTNR